MLLADIGGTNLRVAVLKDQTSEPDYLPVVQAADHPTLVEAFKAVLDDSPYDDIQGAMLAFAGPVDGATFRLTNNPWIIDPAALQRELGLREAMMVNDYEAEALALPTLAPQDILMIGDGAPVPDDAKLVLGPGTGLGAAGLVRTAAGWCPIAGEAGHSDLGPAGEEELALWPHIEQVSGRITVETILSGSGIIRLYRAYAVLEGVEPVHQTAPEITAAAEAGDPLASRTMARFARLFGRVAGDLALIFLARGGVYLAGGVVEKTERWLTDGSFRAAFCEKAPHAEIMARIPTQIIKHPFPALLGLAALARAPGNFAMDCDRRRWRA